MSLIFLWELRKDLKRLPDNIEVGQDVLILMNDLAWHHLNCIIREFARNLQIILLLIHGLELIDLVWAPVLRRGLSHSLGQLFQLLRIGSLQIKCL